MPILDRRKDRFVEDQDSRVSVGIDFPFGRVPNSGDGYFKTSKTTIDAIKNNQDPEITGKDIFNVMDICFAIWESYQKKITIDVSYIL